MFQLTACGAVEEVCKDLDQVIISQEPYFNIHMTILQHSFPKMIEFYEELQNLRMCNSLGVTLFYV